MKSTVIYNGFAFLLFNVLLYHLVRDVALADRQITSRPEMSAPELLSQMRELQQQYARAYAFQPLHEFAHVLSRSIRYKHVYMIARHFARDDVNLVLQSNLAQNISGADCYLAYKNTFPVFGYPNQMNFQVCFGMGASFIKSHSDNSKLFFA